MHASSFVGLTNSPIFNSLSMLPPTGSLINGRLAMVGTFTGNNLAKAPNAATVQPANPRCSSETVRSLQHNQVLAPSNQSSMTNPSPQNVPQQSYPPFLSVSAQMPPPQAHWLPPQATGLQCLPLSQYPAVLPGPPPFSVRGMPPPSVPSPDVQPPGVPSEVNCGEAPTSTPESSFPEAKDVQEDGNVKSEELEA